MDKPYQKIGLAVIYLAKKSFFLLKKRRATAYDYRLYSGFKFRQRNHSKCFILLKRTECDPNRISRAFRDIHYSD